MGFAHHEGVKNGSVSQLTPMRRGARQLRRRCASCGSRRVGEGSRTRVRRTGACVGALVALCAILATRAAARAATVSLPVARDTTVMEAHPRDNDGAWGYLWVKWNSARGFENRVLLGFDLTPLAGRAADVSDARLVLHAADHTFPKRGTALSAHFMDPAAAVPWSEGSLHFDRFSFCGQRALFRPPTGEGGPGATWACEDDHGATDVLGGASCAPSALASPWRGGLPDAGAAAGVARGFRSTATTSQVEHKDHDPLCRKALRCFAETGRTDCWRVVEIDVSADVREALSLGVADASWMLRKNQVEAGAARFFSREGARCLVGIPALAPELRVTVSGESQPPVVVPEPQLDCGG